MRKMKKRMCGCVRHEREGQKKSEQHLLSERYFHKQFAIGGVGKTLDSLVWSIRGVFQGLVLEDVKGADRVIHPVRVNLDAYEKGDDISGWYVLKVQKLFLLFSVLVSLQRMRFTCRFRRLS